MARKIKVVELFAGVGVFRLGLEGWKGKSALSGYEKDLDSGFRVIWSNQWEPGKKQQHASEVYEHRFGIDAHSNADISTVPTDAIPDHDMLVGGFPCQDYSVAATLNRSGGIQGKKGVLWWQIHRILDEKGAKRPKFLVLENVDRLLKSPAKQRGRDFAIMLTSLSDLGYAVEWRIINAAEYGMPQRRRRIFIVGYLEGTKPYKALAACPDYRWLTEKGILAEAFPVISRKEDSLFPDYLEFKEFDLEGDLKKISDTFGSKRGQTFENSGFMIQRKVTTLKTKPRYEGGTTTLGDILQPEAVAPSFFIPSKDMAKWKHLKGAKSYDRTTSEGYTYRFTEGGMVFPDPLDKPCRTIITGEGGSSPSRFKHVIMDPIKGKLRRLTPLELERANMFPDNHTDSDGSITDQTRAFFMGNALVVGVVEKIGIEIYKRHTSTSKKRKS